jgi:large subunit ribosomal protein L21
MAAKTDTHSYAIISLGGKQYVVREGERLLVDRVATDEGKTFHPDILFLGDGGKSELAPKNATVTAKVVGHVLGEKVRIGKYRPKTGYRRHTGFRARLSQIEIESIAGGATKHAAAEKEEPAPKEEPAQKPPKGYPDLTVTEINDQSRRWSIEQLEAALDHERAHANRKGAIAALESALAAREEKEG